MYDSYSDAYEKYKKDGIRTPIIIRPKQEIVKEEYVIIDDKVIPGVVPDRYLISNYGKIYDKDRDRYLNYSQDKDGYNMASISLVDGYKKVRVHRVEMLAFKYTDDAKNLQVNHRDGNASNNVITNLEWTTPKENSDHAMLKGLHRMHGSDNPLAKLTEDDVHKICQLIETGKYFDTEIAKMFNVSYTNISDIHKGKIWKDVSKNYDMSKRRSKGSSNSN